MKAYEEWFLKNLCDDEPFSEPAWRAALEWVLKDEYLKRKARKRIEKELNAKTEKRC